MPQSPKDGGDSYFGDIIKLSGGEAGGYNGGSKGIATSTILGGKDGNDGTYEKVVFGFANEGRGGESVIKTGDGEGRGAGGNNGLLWPTDGKGGYLKIEYIGE